MREERGIVTGDVVIYEPYTLWGSISGNVNVIERGKFYLRGAVYGDVTVEYGGRVHIFGRITGTLTVMRGAKVIHSGVVGGDAVNQGGRLHIDNVATVLGKVKTLKGETDIQPKPRPME